jgi:hypothetical protein
MEKMTTPQRLDMIQARMADRTAAFNRRADATRTFYATLTPEQQKTFDTETLQFGMRGHEGMQGREGRGRHMPPAAPQAAPQNR